MKLFKSHQPNTFHYTTSVTHNRVPVFTQDKSCELFIEALKETRTRLPLKLIGYVIMPDHVHMIMNPLCCDISKVMNFLQSASARKIIDWLLDSGFARSLKKLQLARPQKRGHIYSVWQKGFSAVDLWTPRFIRQKLHYIHMNPVRAGLCKHPAEWKWSSYRAYRPHQPGTVPIEIDPIAYWTEEELETGIPKPAKKER
jgi:putative transposase